MRAEVDVLYNVVIIRLSIMIFIAPVKWRVEFFRLRFMFLLTRISTSLKCYFNPSGAANEGSIKTAPRGAINR